MLEISVTFEEFQLVFNFMLFFTLTLLFSIQEKYKVAKIWGGGLQLPQPPVSTGLGNISRFKLIKDRLFAEAYLERCQAYRMEFFCENSEHPKIVNYFCVKLNLGCLTLF